MDFYGDQNQQFIIQVDHYNLNNETLHSSSGEHVEKATSEKDELSELYKHTGLEYNQNEKSLETNDVSQNLYQDHQGIFMYHDEQPTRFENFPGHNQDLSSSLFTGYQIQPTGPSDLIDSNGDVTLRFSTFDPTGKDKAPPLAEERQYKGKETVVTLVGDDTKTRGTDTKRTISKKTRTIHNQKAGRRHRRKINDRLEILSQMIPDSPKKNKAELIDQVISYIQSLQKDAEYLQNRLAERAGGQRIMSG